MSQIHNVLYCPFGERGNELAMRRIAALAADDARTTILDVVTAGHPHVARLSLGALRRDPAMVGHQIEVVVQTGNRTDVINEYALAGGYDLVVITPEDEPGAIKTARRLVRTCPVPLLILRPKTDHTDRVLVAVNPSKRSLELNRKLLDWGSTMAEDIGCDLDFVHTWEYWGEEDLRNSAFFQTDLERLDQRIEIERSQHLVATEKWLADEGVVVDPHNLHVPKGRVAPTVAQVARSVGAPLVVAGSVGRRGIRRLIMGNSAEELVDVLPCSILVVK